VFGLTKQGYYQRIKRDNKRMERNQTVLSMIEQIRKKHPRAGTCKLMVYIRPELERASLTIGRDALNRLLRDGSAPLTNHRGRWQAPNKRDLRLFSSR
jgi:hypothetical protein